MTTDLLPLSLWLKDIALSLDEAKDPVWDPNFSLLTNPELPLQVIELLAEIEEDSIEKNDAYYAACIYVLDTCVAQLQSAKEAGNRHASKILQQVMRQLADKLSHGEQSLNFWLPVLNAFYDVQVELLPELQDAYLELAEEEPLTDALQTNHLIVMRDMILEMSHLSIFDIAENFFAQSYAMPADFFADFIVDLYNIPEAHDIALLILLYPRYEVRQVAVDVFEALMDSIVLSSHSLTRLQTIKYWYPEEYHAQFDRWLKIQRKKGVVYQPLSSPSKMHIDATEVDGAGAQGFYIRCQSSKKYCLAGLLVKIGVGVKDVWVTPWMSAKELTHNFEQIDDGTVTLRQVEPSFMQLMVNHFLAVSLQQGNIPDLHLLEVQELLGMTFKPVAIDLHAQINQRCIQISPFTAELVNKSLARSKKWTTTKTFTESWYLENMQVDKLVNQWCTIVEGTKICNLAKATETIFKQILEQERSMWCFHFLWTALWAMANPTPKKNDYIGIDCLILAYVIDHQMPLTDIPIMQEICKQTVMNSVETMNERRTYLT